MHIYASHLGGLYTLDEYLDGDDLYCDQCGDWDDYIGECNTADDARKLIYSTDASEYYDKRYIEDFIKENFQ